MMPGQTALIRMPRGGVFECGAAGQADHSVLGGVVGGAAGQADEPAEGGTVDDRAAALGAHVAQFVLQAGPHATEVDGVDAVEHLGVFVGGVGGRHLDAGVVVGHVEAAEGLHRAVDGGGDLVLVGDVADDGDDAVALVAELLGGGHQGGFVDVGESDGGTGFGEGARGGESHAGGGAGDEGDLTVEVVGGVHGVSRRKLNGRTSSTGVWST